MLCLWTENDELVLPHIDLILAKWNSFRINFADCSELYLRCYVLMLFYIWSARSSYQVAIIKEGCLQKYKSPAFQVPHTNNS